MGESVSWPLKPPSWSVRWTVFNRNHFHYYGNERSCFYEPSIRQRMVVEVVDHGIQDHGKEGV